MLRALILASLASGAASLLSVTVCAQLSTPPQLSAFARAVAGTLGAAPSAVQVTDSMVQGRQTVISLATDVPQAGAALFANGTNGTAAFWNNVTAMGINVNGCLFSAPPPPPMATWGRVSQGLQIAFNKPLADWQYAAYALNPAVQSAISDALGIAQENVWIYQNSIASQGGTVVTFDIVYANSDSTSSDGFVIPAPTIQYGALFTHTCLDANAETNLVAACICNNNTADGCTNPPQANWPYYPGAKVQNGFVTANGDPASPLLVQKLAKYGLDMNAYYFDQPM